MDSIVGVDRKRVNEALTAWSSYVDSLNDAAGYIVAFLKVEKISHKALVQLLSDGSNEIFVSLHKLKKDYPETMDLKKMLSLDLLPHFYSDIIKNDAIEYEKCKHRAREFFNNYDASLLRTGESIYEINDDFKIALTQAFTRLTKNEEENEDLAQLLSIVKGLNYFIPSRIRFAYGLKGIEPLLKMIKISDDSTKFDIQPYLFMKD